MMPQLRLYRPIPHRVQAFPHPATRARVSHHTGCLHKIPGQRLQFRPWFPL